MSGFLQKCADKNCIKMKFLLYLLKDDHSKMKSFIAPLLEALTRSVYDLTTSKGE